MNGQMPRGREHRRHRIRGCGASTPRCSEGSRPPGPSCHASALGHDRGLRAHAGARADLLLRAQRILLGDQRIDPVGARERRPGRRAPGRRLLPGTGKAGELAFRASPYGAGAGSVAFNFDWSFDYYPLAYQRPGPADEGLPIARRALRVARTWRVAPRGYPGVRCPPPPTQTGAISPVRSSWPAGAQGRSGPTRLSGPSWRATARSSARAGTRSTAARTRRSTRSRRAGWPT